jgi:hypothetical protein
MIEQHIHEGTQTPKIDFINITGQIRTVSAIPNNKPNKSLFEQIRIYKSGATKRLYIYDFVNNEWDYSSLT